MQLDSLDPIVGSLIQIDPHTRASHSHFNVLQTSTRRYAAQHVLEFLTRRVNPNKTYSFSNVKNVDGPTSLACFYRALLEVCEVCMAKPTTYVVRTGKEARGEVALLRKPRPLAFFSLGRLGVTLAMIEPGGAGAGR